METFLGLFHRRRTRPWLSGSTSSEDEDSSADDEHTEAKGDGRPIIAKKRRRRIQRILQRDGLEYQSRGIFNIRHRKKSRSLFATDLYHVLVHMPFWGLFIIFTVVYIISFTFFAWFWYLVSDTCNVGLDTYRKAFYISLETQMTIGYGVPDPTFDDCLAASFLLVTQTIVGLMLDAVIIGVVFQQVSSAYHRASTVVFSDTAVLQVIDGVIHLMFRVAEMHRHPLLQSVMQVYCVQHHKDPHAPSGRRVELTTVLLEEPDTDVYNGVLFLGLPAVVVHKVDWKSPLAPDAPEGATGYPSYQDVRKYLSESPYLEVLVLLSGTEDATASCIEARHSYTLEDMFWHRSFAPCVAIDAEGCHCVDFRAIHHTVPLQHAGQVRSSGGRHIHGHFDARLERSASVASDGTD